MVPEAYESTKGSCPASSSSSSRCGAWSPRILYSSSMLSTIDGDQPGLAVDEFHQVDLCETAVSGRGKKHSLLPS